MALLIDKSVSNNSRLLVWKVSESLDELRNGTLLTPQNEFRYNGMKSTAHQCAFISVRHLLALAGYTDGDLLYDEFGKPHLADGKHISISHSHNFAAVIISDKTVGVDLEWAREKIIRIATKFAANEMPFLQNRSNDDLILCLTVIWGVKESIFKIRNEPGISFQHHVRVLPFEIGDRKATGILDFGNVNVSFDVHFEIVEEFVLVYAFPSN